MNFTCIFFGVVFCIAGIVFACGKAHIHLAAWKAMPQEEKDKINIVPLCRNIGGVIALCGLIFLVSGLWMGFKDHFFGYAMVAWLVFAGVDVYCIGKKDRYRSK